MTEQDQIKALAELDGWIITLFYAVSSKGCRCSKGGIDQFGDDFTRLVPPYLHSYDAIIPLIQKQPLELRQSICHYAPLFPFTWATAIMQTPSQLCEALLRATGKWIE